MEVFSFANETYTKLLVNSDYDWNLFIDKYNQAAGHDTIVVDIETSGLRYWQGAEIIGLALYFPSIRFAAYIPYRHGEGYNVSKLNWEFLQENILYNKKNIIGWNFKFDLAFLMYDGFGFDDGVYFQDGMVALHLLDENRYERQLNYKLKSVAKEFVGYTAADEEVILGAKLKELGYGKGDMWHLPATDVADYAMMDVILTHWLWRYFNGFLEKWSQTELYLELSRYLYVLTRMELTGVLVDREAIAKAIENTKVYAADLLAQIRELTGSPNFNPNSPQQVSAILGTDDAKRSTLKKQHNTAAKLIIQYKAAAKSVGTFYEPYLEQSDDEGWLHPSLNIIGTVSGRLSSSNPNLQQVPRKAEMYDVKSVFVAPEGFTIVQADYKAQELRLAAHYAREEKITRVFNEGGDPHQMTADMMGIDRQTGKTLNFGLLYGMGAEKASEFLGIDISEARKLVPAWHNLYPAFRDAHNKYIHLAQTFRNPDGSKALNSNNGYQFIRLFDGRIRHYSGVEHKFFSSWNTVIQGSGAIIMRRALQAIDNEWKFRVDYRVQMVLTVHDSVILYVLDEYLDEALPKIKALMEGGTAAEFNPPMEVEIAIGKVWSDLRKVDI